MDTILLRIAGPAKLYKVGKSSNIANLAISLLLVLFFLLYTLQRSSIEGMVQSMLAPKSHPFSQT